MTVFLVGAGPGDPGLLTVRGADLLAQADVVVFDRLAAPSLVDLAPPTAERIDVGKAPGRVAMDQDGINAVLTDRGRRGLSVVRLKGGDPFVFGRGGEEAEALATAGVAFEVVPGITSSIAAPAYAGIPVTHRGVSTHFTVVTGHEDPAKGRSDVDWEAVARVGGTLVILMGAGHIGHIAQRLRAGGLAPDTPVAAVRAGTRPDQHTIRTTLGAVADDAAGVGIRPPSAIVVGAVAALDLSWFERRPLFGRRVVVTRARGQASRLTARLEALGAEVVELPSIAVEPIDFDIPNLERYAWIVFTSVNGVEHFFTRAIDGRGLDARALAHLRIAAIGPGTAGALARRGLRVDLVPERFVAESLLESFPVPGAPGERVLLAQAEIAREVLPEGLGALGRAVDVLAVYRTHTATPDPSRLEVVRGGAIDAVTFTSASTVTNFCDLVGTVADPPPAVISIGPITSATASERGLAVTAEADPHTIDGLVQALLAVFDSESRWGSIR
ncbi:MAG TPA: uroporphyrinogen-III C-methyltransferase [Acidimicrobiia bacterium]|nr:uroporphyrinogen-III C-methyltransferase [Acidimicrobiia bacterium]